jgi:hypothetical protein
MALVNGYRAALSEQSLLAVIGGSKMWLFNSTGTPIAFASGANVFSADGKFLGKIDGNEVWNGTYVGEIADHDYLFRRTSRAGAARMTPMSPMTPMTPMTPMSRVGRSLPSGYEDIE